MYYGEVGLDLIFHMFFLLRYSRMLEEGAFRGRVYDYAYMLILAAIAMIVRLFHVLCIVKTREYENGFENSNMAKVDFD